MEEMLKATIKTTRKPEDAVIADEMTMHAADREELDRNFGMFVERWTDDYGFEIVDVEEQSLGGMLSGMMGL
jgi:hypothetical protein